MKELGVTIVTATKVPEEAFARGTLLGQSLTAIPKQLRPNLIVRYANVDDRCLGLSTIFNQALHALNPKKSPIVVFCHDDIYIHDWFLVERLRDALQQFDLVGIMGCQHALPDQVGWSVRLNQDREREFLPFKMLKPSGTINHFTPHSPRPEYQGPAGRECALLDGCFMAINFQRVKDRGLTFDERYEFHCYDTDFCVRARRHRLRVATWPIAVTHGSPGGFGRQWQKSARSYLSSMLKNI